MIKNSVVAHIRFATTVNFPQNAIMVKLFSALFTYSVLSEFYALYPSCLLRGSFEESLITLC